MQVDQSPSITIPEQDIGSLNLTASKRMISLRRTWPGSERSPSSSIPPTPSKMLSEVSLDISGFAGRHCPWKERNGSETIRFPDSVSGVNLVQFSPFLHTTSIAAILAYVGPVCQMQVITLQVIAPGIQVYSNRAFLLMRNHLPADISYK